MKKKDDPVLELHPLTVKSLRKGHPWVTTDKFSSKFPSQQKIISLYDSRTNDYLGEFIHDPQHPKVKARFWCENKDGPFKVLLRRRLDEALKKRTIFPFKRTNFYILFAEADKLPGLCIQKLGENILIQYEAFFWEEKLVTLSNYFQERAHELGIQSIWSQKRIPGEKKISPKLVWGEKDSSKIVIENDIQFMLYFDQKHDIGLYTDMASIRDRLRSYFKNSSHILNLFSYTGAFSLYGLQEGKKVDSVDISSQYMNWLEKNIEINNFDKSLHRSHIYPVEKMLKNFDKSNARFDLVICDPPSSFTDGKKKISVKDFYKKNMASLIECLSVNGYLIAFTNTHSTPRAKWRKLMKELIAPFSDTEILDELKMGDDCPILPHFPEGDYLKGIIIKKKTGRSKSY